MYGQQNVKLNEERDARPYIRRPYYTHASRESCVDGKTGRYEIPSMTPKAPAYFAKMRADVGGNGAHPRSDAPLTAKMKEIR